MNDTDKKQLMEDKDKDEFVYELGKDFEERQKSMRELNKFIEDMRIFIVTGKRPK